MSRALLVASAAAPVTCVVLSACGSSVHGISSRPLILKPVPPSPVALRFSTASNRATAQHDVGKLIGLVVLPAAAKHVRDVPRSAPSWFRDELSEKPTGAVIANRTWIVDAPLPAVVRYFRAHLPPRPRRKLEFPIDTSRIRSPARATYLFHPIPGRSSSRWLSVDMLALPRGKTLVNAQAGNQWIHPPPARAELPGTVRRITITSRYFREKPSVRLHVRDRYLVSSIVSWVNGLGVGPHYVCFGGWGPVVTLGFRDARGKLVARGRIADLGGDGRSGSCNPLSLTVNGHAAPPLTADELLPRIQQQLGANLAPPRPHEVSSCLRERGWHVRRIGDRLVARMNGQLNTITFHATGKVTTTGPPHRAVSRCIRSSPDFVYYK